MSEKLEQLSDELTELFAKRARRFKRASFFVKFMLLALASAVVSTMQFLQIPADGRLTAVQVAGICGSLLVFAGAAITLITEDDASEELNKAREATETAREMQQLLDSTWIFEAVVERAIQLYQSAMVLRGVIESASVVGAPIGDVLSSFMDATRRSLPIAMGFELSDVWTICVFRAEQNPEGNRDHLHCVAHNRTIACAINEARVWSEGIGVAGISYANRSEIIVPDLRSFNLGSMFNLATGAKSYDDDRYRSIVSVPINVEGRAKPWGVVVATSDRVNHFSPDDGSGPKTTEPVRLLAAMVALAAVMCQETKEASTGGQAAPPIGAV